MRGFFKNLKSCNWHSIKAYMNEGHETALDDMTKKINIYKMGLIKYG